MLIHTLLTTTFLSVSVKIPSHLGHGPKGATRLAQGSWRCFEKRIRGKMPSNSSWKSKCQWIAWILLRFTRQQKTWLQNNFYSYIRGFLKKDELISLSHILLRKSGSRFQPSRKYSTDNHVLLSSVRCGHHLQHMQHQGDVKILSNMLQHITAVVIRCLSVNHVSGWWRGFFEWCT